MPAPAGVGVGYLLQLSGDGSSPSTTLNHNRFIDGRNMSDQMLIP